MAHHLGRGMRLIVAGLAPERIIVVGDLTRSWHRFGPVIEAEVQDQVLPAAAVPAVVPTHEDGMARLRGTIALRATEALQRSVGLPIVAPQSAGLRSCTCVEKSQWCPPRSSTLYCRSP